MKLPIVLSASRMTDMPAFYANEIISEVEKRIQKGVQIHTLVLWTKFPHSLLVNPLYEYLLYLKSLQIQLYVQLTISGMGGIITNLKNKASHIIIEPNVLEYKESLATLPDVLHLVEKPERIRLRIDPILKVEDAFGNVFSNEMLLPEIIIKTSLYGIKDYDFSFLEPGVHTKVDRRFRNVNSRIISFTDEEREKFNRELEKLQKEFKISVFACSVKGFPVSKCIDGDLLSSLHNQHLTLSKKQLFKRDLCGCTVSVDIGGWPPKKCFSGCLYCYSNPSQ